ncbi:MAG TPA: T9SS type A sorting domain-containing protein [Bacteroidales bacterium]|nr:T9SS type A sorting domain-containing protein [Bacteroidales bacterium]HOS73449.1 T9SS type A sorting domain-containing protein [Bacteroidales bacterium]
MFLVSEQCFSQQVVSSTGTSAEGANVRISWTVGEPMIGTFTGTSVILTQGFHQSKLTITSLKEIDLPSFEVNVYPNPFFSQLQITVTKGDWNNLQYLLFSLDGKLLQQKVALNQVETMNLESFAQGVYLLKVSGHHNQTIRTFLVIKN